MRGLLPDDVRVGELLQQADLSYNAVLVHVVFVDLHHHHFPTGAVNHLQDIGVTLLVAETVSRSSNRQW